MTKVLTLAAVIAATLAATAATAQRGPQGPVSRDAYLADQKTRFAEMDANHDGVVTKDELVAGITAFRGKAPPADRADEMFKTLDADGDGKATVAESDAAAAARFTALDADKDGMLTIEEYRAGAARMMRR